jgi:hypothetical protein
MTQPNPPPEWLKEWATVLAKVAGIVFVVFRILRAIT